MLRVHSVWLRSLYTIDDVVPTLAEQACLRHNSLGTVDGRRVALVMVDIYPQRVGVTEFYYRGCCSLVGGASVPLRRDLLAAIDIWHVDVGSGRTALITISELHYVHHKIHNYIVWLTHASQVQRD